MKIAFELTEEELQQLLALMDAAVKAAGLQAVTSAAGLLQKLDDAVKASKEGNNVINMKDAANG